MASCEKVLRSFHRSGRGEYGIATLFFMGAALHHDALYVLEVLTPQFFEIERPISQGIS